MGEPREEQEDVGVDGDSRRGDGGETQAEVAQAQHQGAQRQHLPPRSNTKSNQSIVHTKYKQVLQK